MAPWALYVLGVGQAQLGEPPRVDPHFSGLGLLGAQGDLPSLGTGDMGAGAVLHPLPAGLIESSGEQHLITRVQAVRAPGKLGALLAELSGTQAPQLGYGVEAVKLGVGGVADHYAPTFAHVQPGAVPVVDHALPGLLTGIGDV